MDRPLCRAGRRGGGDKTEPQSVRRSQGLSPSAAQGTLAPRPGPVPHSRWERRRPSAHVHLAPAILPQSAGAGRAQDISGTGLCGKLSLHPFCSPRAQALLLSTALTSPASPARGSTRPASPHGVIDGPPTAWFATSFPDPPRGVSVNLAPGVRTELGQSWGRRGRSLGGLGRQEQTDGRQ